MVNISPRRTGAKHLQHNQHHIEKYLDNFDRIHGSAAGSEVPAGKESKGMRQFVAPISNTGFNYLDDEGNREAATLLSSIFASMRREAFPYYYACGLVAGWSTQRSQFDDEGDYGTLKRWKASEDHEHRDALAVFEAATLWAAERLPKGTTLDVHASGARASKTPKEGAALDREERLREQHAASHRMRYRQLREIEKEYPKATREAAKAMWSDRYDMSVSTIERAIRFCEKHEWPAVEGAMCAPVELCFRWREGQSEAG